MRFGWLPVGTTARVGAAGLVAMAPAVVHAQGAGASTAPEPTWRFRASAGTGWYENAYFLAGPEIASLDVTGNAGLQYSRRLRTGSLGAGAFVGTHYYPELKGLSHPTYGANVTLGLAPSPRTQWVFAQLYSRTSTRELAFDEQALPLPTTSHNRFTTSAGLSQLLPHSFQLNANASLGVNRYDDPALAGGESLFIGAQLGRPIDATASVYASYSFRNSWYSGTQFPTHQMLLGAKKTLLRGLGIDAAFGAAYYRGRWQPAGRANLDGLLGGRGRRTSFGVRYRHELDVPLGYGRLMNTDVVSATFGWTPAQRVRFSAGYFYSYRRDIEDPDFRIHSQGFSSGVSYGVTRELSASVGYGYDWIRYEGEPSVQGSRVTASVSYGVEWR